LSPEWQLTIRAIFFTMSEITLPGLVDVHTHLRVPGGEHKEDFDSGTAAAIAGGITTVLAMPNTTPPLATAAVLQETRVIAASTVRCQVGLFAGASPSQLDHLADCAPYAIGLKVYLNDTYGPLRVDDLSDLRRCFKEWPRDKLIAMHAEQQSVAVGIALAQIYERPVHFCHISRRQEIELIADAKMAGIPVTCEIAPHHLFLSKQDTARLGPLADMRPVLAPPDDVASLWEHLADTVDCIATDHAPHTLQEKRGENPPPGVPGLETSLPLMLTAVHDNRLTMKQLTTLMADNPRRIYSLKETPQTWVVVDVDASHEFPEGGWQTKCDWSPFSGMPVRGKIRKVVFGGKTVFSDGHVLAAPGSGQLIPE
jgi:carbamoyl-phosphate synthase/aspartate carbamoyltransferase/dihydroorotase